MKTNNGKIAIAIVAMFAVALSVIGFTYAYFTARITGNTKDKSVEISAGQLVVNYTSGDVIEANNIVPGWKSDGLSYYLPGNVDTNGNIIAKHVSTTAELEQAANMIVTDSGSRKATSTDGITTPATFSVANTGDNKNAAHYIIRLNVLENSLRDIIDPETSYNDKNSMKVFLYKGSFDDFNNTNDEFIYGAPLTTSTTVPQIIVPETIDIANGATDDYYVMLEYDNVDFDQSDNMGSTVRVKVEIVGVSDRDNGTFDAAGNEITFTDSPIQP